MASIKSTSYTDPTISTTKYKSAHGKNPTGTGAWVFYITYKFLGSDSFWTEDVEDYFVGGKYSEAAKAAKLRCRSLGGYKIEVGS